MVSGVTARGTLAAGAGIACAFGAETLYVGNNAAMKWLAADYPSGEILFFRGAFVVVPIAFLVARFGGVTKLRIRSARGHAARGLMTVADTFCWVIGLSYLPLADMTAIAFTGPLFLVAMASAVLSERVGWRRWSAVAAGFVGVLIMTRPGAGAWQWAFLLPLGSAFWSAARDILTRRLSATETSLSMVATTTLAIILAGLATAPFGWRWPEPADLAVMALAGLLLGLGNYLAIESYRLAEVAVVAPFKYTDMVWAVLLGYILWGQLPDRWMVAGAAVVTASGLYILHRETRRRTAAR